MSYDPYQKKSLEETLEASAREAEEREAERTAARVKLPYLDLRLRPIEVDALRCVPENVAREAKLACVGIKGKKLLVVINDPDNQKEQEILASLKTTYEVSTVVVSNASLEKAWGFYKLIPPPVEEITGSVGIESEKLQEYMKSLNNVASIKQAVTSFQDPLTSKILEIILAGALASDASDMHLEPEEDVVRFRLRIDGDLHDVADFSHAMYRSILSRIKLISGLKINIKNIAQDGRFTIHAGVQEIEIRTSVVPSAYGETVVMRILNPKLLSIKLEDLGIRDDDLAIVQEELEKPNGAILNTGPTGSGKTTTLYAFLKRVYNPKIKIITIEDPIEYHIEGISQTQVEPERGYTFVSGLKAALRQDPDVILIGEIRDFETAETAMQASLTGHLVFSTLHTNEASGAIPRLLDMGVKPATIGPALNLIIAQRLVRTLCNVCKEKITPTEEQRKRIEKLIATLPSRVARPDPTSLALYAPKGCDKCNNGFRGRIGVYEFLLITKELEEYMQKSPTTTDVKRVALKNGMTTMGQDGLLKILKGITTFEEVESVVGKIEATLD
ncbi:MAG: type II/IV secretion system protein [Patescibacteria group bacterium]|nr:type II/IV secretion system protein [Patescibacteria group bacterium]MDE2438470.1 type II/IV secretion system protein [Patescibacteria group bacterium]